MNYLLKALRLGVIAIALSIVVVLLSPHSLILQGNQKAAQVASTPQTTSSISVPSSTSRATSFPDGSTAFPTVNLNIHSTKEGIASNFVVTAWANRPVIILDSSDPQWYKVSYVTTDNQTVEGYVVPTYLKAS